MAGSDLGLTPSVMVEFINAGHRLGSAYARVCVAAQTILFGGDLGRYGRPVLPDPTPVSEADILLLESTYGDRLHEPDDNGTRLAVIATTRLTTVASPQQTADLVASRQPSIVIASSGMATGGRVLRHLAATITNPKHTVMFVGYQAAGTRGRLLVDGAREVKLLGRVYPVAAQVERIDSMSAHADYSESLRWLSGFTRAPPMTYLVHGDPIALAALATRITTEQQWPVHIAAHHERVEIPA